MLGIPIQVHYRVAKLLTNACLQCVFCQNVESRRVLSTQNILCVRYNQFRIVIVYYAKDNCHIEKWYLINFLNCLKKNMPLKTAHRKFNYKHASKLRKTATNPSFHAQKGLPTVPILCQKLSPRASSVGRDQTLWSRNHSGSAGSFCWRFLAPETESRCHGRPQTRTKWPPTRAARPEARDGAAPPEMENNSHQHGFNEVTQCTESKVCLMSTDFTKLYNVPSQEHVKFGAVNNYSWMMTGKSWRFNDALSAWKSMWFRSQHSNFTPD